MVKVDLERALNRKESEFMLIGKGLENLPLPNDKKMRMRLEILKDKGVMSFAKINELIHYCLDDLSYITFWDDVEIILIE